MHVTKVSATKLLVEVACSDGLLGKRAAKSSIKKRTQAVQVIQPGAKPAAWKIHDCDQMVNL